MNITRVDEIGSHDFEGELKRMTRFGGKNRKGEVLHSKYNLKNKKDALFKY